MLKKLSILIFISLVPFQFALSREVPQDAKLKKVKKGESLYQILKNMKWQQEDLAVVLGHPKLKRKTIFPGEIYMLTDNGLVLGR